MSKDDKYNIVTNWHQVYRGKIPRCPLVKESCMGPECGWWIVTERDEQESIRLHTPLASFGECSIKRIARSTGPQVIEN